MLNWLARKRYVIGCKLQEAELREFVGRLRASDPIQIGMLLAVATEQRHRLESQGYCVLDPISGAVAAPTLLPQLSKAAHHHKKTGNPAVADAVMVWVYTARAALGSDLSELGAKMWLELSRGFPFVEYGAQQIFRETGTRPNTEGATQLPKGVPLDLIYDVQALLGDCAKHQPRS